MFKYFLPCLLLSSLPLLAAPQHAANYDDAATLAKQQQLPYLVLIHGSSWHKASQTFIDQLWNNDEIRNSLEQSFIYTEIHLKQQLTAEQIKEEEKTRKTWKKPPLIGYPAIQLYSHDGQLLSQCKGKTLRNISTQPKFSAYLKKSFSAVTKRRLILQQIKQADANNKPEQEIKLIGELVSLPLQYDQKSILHQLQQLDPKDKSNWQERIKFNNWPYISHITGLIKAGKTNDALQETNQRLAKDYYSPEQRAFLLAAKGIIIASTGDHKNAWPQFQKASELSPNSPDVEALFRQGERISLLPLRAGFTKGSELYGKNVGNNISREQATFTMSSIAYDDKSKHSSLLKGPYKDGAFHTNKENTAHIIIDLKDICSIQAVQILNIGGSNLSRAKTLTLFTSKNQSDWEKVWQAEDAKPEWQVLLENPTKARYIKIALDSQHPEFLHLKGVNVFGKRS